MKDKDLEKMVKKINDMNNTDEEQYNKKLEELKNTIGKDKVDKKIKDFEKKYGNKLSDYIKKIEDLNKNSTKQEKAELILKMKKKLSPEQQAKFNQAIDVFKKYMKNM